MNHFEGRGGRAYSLQAYSGVGVLMLPINWKTAIDYAVLVSIAESVEPSAGYAVPEKAAITKAGYSFLQPIYGDDLCTDIDPHIGAVVTYGFLAVSSSKEIVVAIRGTDTIWEWLHDASFLMVPTVVPGAQGLTEDGFSAVYRSLRVAPADSASPVRDAIKGHLETGAGTTVTICGHSLGGSLATLLTLDVVLNSSCRSPTSYTYASPRVGDHLFASFYNAAVPNTYRIVNRQDLVPQLPFPLPLPYEHVNTGYELKPPPRKIASTIACMHHLTTYLWLMDQLAETSAHALNPQCDAEDAAQLQI